MKEVIPIDDLKEHIEGMECHCKPIIKDGVIVHSSYDGREAIEETNLILGVPNTGKPWKGFYE